MYKLKLLRQDLASLLSRLEYGDYDEAVDVEEGENGYLSEFIRSAFLPPLKKGREEGQTQYMAHGHRAEKPFLREFFEITQRYDHHTSVSIKAVYSPGCVMHKSLIYLCDSSNGVVICSRDDDGDSSITYGARPAEVKSRSAPRTFQRERINITQVRRMLLDDDGENSYFYSKTRQMIQFMLVFVRIAWKVIRMTMRNPIAD